MLTSFPHSLATLFYSGAAVLFSLGWLLLLKDSAQRKPWLAMVLVGVVCLAAALGLALVFGVATNHLRFGFAQALSLCAWLAAALLLLDKQVETSAALWRLLTPFCAVASVLAAIFPGATVDATRPWFGAHLAGAAFSYSLILLASGLALVMAASEKSLHSPSAALAGKGSAWLSDLPPLLVLERLMFRVTATGFVALSLTLLSGFFFSEEVFGRAMRFDHKTVFALAAWLVFAVLLIGRKAWGWRGKRAVRFTLSGFGLLLLAYVGTHFVLEVVLRRGLA